MGTKLKPGKWDCYANAEPDEPYFTLLARDASAAVLVREWAMTRKREIIAGRKPKEDADMVTEALQLAEAMEHWRHKNRGGGRV
jgi:hypothetical protein